VAQAERLAEATEKDARLVELILRESAGIVRQRGPVLITETRHGFVCANAGIDASNVGPEGTVCLLPVDPDRSAQGIRAAIRQATGAEVAVIISDTFGRAWREGHTNVAVGLAGMAPFADYVGQVDPFEILPFPSANLGQAQYLLTGTMTRVGGDGTSKKRALQLNLALDHSVGGLAVRMEVGRSMISFDDGDRATRPQAHP